MYHTYTMMLLDLYIQYIYNIYIYVQYIDVTTLNENRGHELGRGQGGVYRRV